MLGPVMTTTRALSSARHRDSWSGLDPDARAVLVELTCLARLRRATRLDVAHEDLCRAADLPLNRVADAVVVLEGQGLLEVFDAVGSSNHVIYILTDFVNEEVPA
jgi:hypothetical protein